MLYTFSARQYSLPARKLLIPA